MKKIFKKFSKKTLIIDFIFPSIFLDPYNYGESIDKKISSSDYLKRNLINNYIFEKEDMLKVSVINKRNILSEESNINAFGKINMRKSRVCVSKLSTTELVSILKKEYKIYLKKSRSNKSKVNFVNLNSNIDIDRRFFNFNSNVKRCFFKNSFLKSGDIFYVGNNILNIAAHVLGDNLSSIKLNGNYKLLDRKICEIALI